MRIAYLTPSTHLSAIDHYRLIGPAYHAGVQTDFFSPNEVVASQASMSQYDIFYMGRDAVKYAKECNAFVSIACQHEKPCVLDLDDNLFDLPENHPDFISGVYAPTLLSLLSLLQEVDAITVPTNTLKESINDLAEAPIHVVPNYLDLNLWGIRPFSAKPKEDQVTILFFGSPSHIIDLPVIAEALKQTYAKYPGKLEYVLYGIPVPTDYSFEFPVRHIPSETFVYQDFPEKIKKINATFGLAPLSDSLFNRAKSPIKFFEYTALGLPTIASNIAPYQSVITDGSNGLLATSTDEWVEAMSNLIESPGRREDLVGQAQTDLKEKWLAEIHTPQWLAMLQGLRSRSGKVKQPLKLSDRFIQRLMDQTQNYMVFQTCRAEELEAAYQQEKKEKEICQGYKSHLEAQRLDLEKTLDDVFSSTSWRITEPLRRLGNWMKRAP